MSKITIENTPKHASATKASLEEVPAIKSYLNAFCNRVEDITEGAILLLSSKNATHTKVAQWPESRELSMTMHNTANAAIQRLKSVTIVPAVSEHGDEQSCIIATPLRSNNKTLGAIVLSIRTSNSEITASRLEDLEQAASTIETMLISAPSSARPADAAKLLALQMVFLDQEKLADGAGAFVNELATMLKFSRVSIGLLKNKQIHIIAMSHSADFKNHQELLRTISSAMEEAADQAESVTFPLLENDKPRIHLASEVMVKKTGNTTCCIPLVDDGIVIGTLSLEHQNQPSLNSETLIWYEKIASFIAPLLTLKQRSEHGWVKRMVESARTSWENFSQQDNPLPKVALGVALITLATLSFVPVTYKIGAQAHIEGATQRILVAPVDGYIQLAKVRPGDTVKAGDVLIKLADQDLLLEKDKWESEVIQQENNFSGALARQDRTQYAISQAKATQARAELALIKQQLMRSRIIAPIDGVVLEGDLSQSLGAPVKLGDTLMKIAPRNQYRLMIDVDERDIADVQTGQKGYLALSAQPVEKMAFVVERITPMAQVKNGHNTFEVEAKLTDSKLFLRPGLLGVAKIEAGKRPIVWSLSHRIINWLRLTFWKWGF